jgi:hypothetical protein
LERTFNDVLAPRNLNRFLASEDGAQRLREVGLPVGARLYTDYLLMGRPRRSMATELICIRPNRELILLLEALRVAIELVRAGQRSGNA